jgi:hypothetical protein
MVSECVRQAVLIPRLGTSLGSGNPRASGRSSTGVIVVHIPYCVAVQPRVRMLQIARSIEERLGGAHCGVPQRALNDPMMRGSPSKSVLCTNARLMEM